MLDRARIDQIELQNDKMEARSCAPSDDEVRAALERIIRSSEFRASPHLAAFLRFSVEKSLAGEGYAIKAYSVATGVLGRPPTFDPQADPIVRVEATRLRRAIERYYLHDGAHDPIRIDIPRGRYIAYFSYRDDAIATADHAVDTGFAKTAASALPIESIAGRQFARAYLRKAWSNLNTGERSSIAIFAIALVGAVMTWSVMPLWEQSHKPLEQALMLAPAPEAQPDFAETLAVRPAGIADHPQQRAVFATLQLTPFDAYSDRSEHHELSRRLTHLIAEKAPEFEGIPVIDPDGPMASNPAHENLYALLGTILQEPQHPDHVELNVRLVQRPSYEIIWTKKYVSESGMSFFDPKLLAIRDDIVQSVAGLYGAIRVDDARRHVENKGLSSSSQICLAESDLALRTGDSERIAKAITCLTAFSEKSPNEAMIFKQLAALRVLDSQNANERLASIEFARHDLQTALSLAPSDQIARQKLDQLEKSTQPNQDK